MSLKFVEDYLSTHGWLSTMEAIEAIEKPGEGNMNCTLRISTSKRSFIFKQARPWVEKYPQISAPEERARIEGRFYKAIEQTPLASYMPALLGLDESSYVLLLEDLGKASDYTSVYRGDLLAKEDCEALWEYLLILHSLQVPESTDFSNKAMRALNHEHIFHFPLLKDNGLDLNSITPGLGHIAQKVKQNSKYVHTVLELGEIYIKSSGPALLHGDFYPGSWLKTSKGIKVIDPEFCFLGPPEFDWGIMLAHLILSQQPSTLIESLFVRIRYQKKLNHELLTQFAGIEIMRRLIGVAQLPLSMGLEKKEQLLVLSQQMVCSPEKHIP